MEQNLSAAFVFLMTIVLTLVMARRLGIPQGTAILLCLWHTAFCLLYWQYAQYNDSDSNAYYNYGVRHKETNFELGTGFVQSVAVLLVQGLALSPLGCFLLFNAFGVLGVVLYNTTLSEAANGVGGWPERVARWGAFSPLISFWSCALAKDPLAFVGCGMAVYASAHLSRRWRWLLVGGLVLLSVRPHMASLLLVALFVALLFGRQVTLPQRIVGLAIATIAGAALLPFVTQYVGLGDLTDLQDSADYQTLVVEYIEKRQSYNLEGGSSVPISEMILPMQLFTFMFRPLFLDAPGVFGLVVSVENMVLVLLFVLTAPRLARLLRQQSSFQVRFCGIFLALGWIALATTTANLGIAVRQKTMLLPALVTLCVLAATHGVKQAQRQD